MSQPEPSRICGVDEAGRGPLAGAVVIAAVILDPAVDCSAINDSKKLSAERRTELDRMIRETALAWHIVSIDRQIIDEINILQATMLGMSQAIAGLNPKPALALIDGNRCPQADCETRAIVGGDALESCIGAASILAKTERDRQLNELHERFPEYGFDRHKGYPTPAHLKALELHGPCPEHRRSYAPVRRLLQTNLGF